MSVSLASYLEERFEEVSPMVFYRELFPQGCLDTRGSFTKGKYTGVVIQVEPDNRVRRNTITDDLEEIRKAISQESFCIISPISYAGRKQNKEAARELYSLTFDLDGIIFRKGYPVGLQELLYQFKRKRIPKPTYLVSSGNGLHLYYLLDKPLRLYPDVYEAVRLYRSALTPYLWSGYVTELSREPQFEAVIQSFRAVGSVTKDGSSRVRAFKVGEKCSLDYLNGFMADGYKLPEGAQRLTLAQAKLLYPDWYERRIVQGKPRASNRRWVVNRAFYDWFKEKIISGELEDPIAKQRHGKGVFEGKRYYSLVCLSSVAVKCDISRQELEKDALELVPILDSRTENENNHFTTEDAMKALEAYNERMVMLPREAMVEFSGLKIDPNKRNGRTRQEQIFLVNMGNQAKKMLGEHIGRPKGSGTKQEEILEYARTHPEANHTQIAKALGISRPTVIKWLKKESVSETI